MKKKIITAVVSVMMILVATASGQIALGPASQKGNIEVVVDGFQNDKGIARIGLCNSTENFKNAEETAVISTTTRIVHRAFVNLRYRPSWKVIDKHL